MLKLVKKIAKSVFGNVNEKELERMAEYVEKINELEEIMKNMSDSSLRQKTDEFKKRIQDGCELEIILPEAFAVVREVSKRVLGMRHFDVQLLGGITLHEGNIAEMRTGEGKTLVATLPAYLNALTGRGVHVVTVNDYLAKRDSEWMGELYEALGLSVGLIVHGLDFEARRKAYAADITYGTNNEFGFDYLRDNMVIHEEQMVQRPLYFAVVDEVDSILIDEARTPLIISGPGEKSTDLYKMFARVVPKLKETEDYTVDEKAHSVVPTESGISKAEKFLNTNIYEEGNTEYSHHFTQALKAHALMHKDKDYVVREGEIVIVDEFTGRLMFGRRYSDGLHQAIEAKEGVKIERESQTLAAITFQNYFRMYEKLSGMTGTAKTEEQEFRKIYGLNVITIPTHMPMVRYDYPDVIYKTKKSKNSAVVKEIFELNQKGQPVLVGTTSIAQSEEFSELLKRKGIKHTVLNAKHHEKEAEIIKQAGQKFAVTIATNMAGRGTDIMLGEGVATLGGLHIIGTVRHESRRIDNQLRGRSGRQGDAGSSRFYLSLEDDLLRLFGDNIAVLMDKLGMEEDVPIESTLVSKAIERAQKKVENHNFNIRKHVLEYDDVMNQQRHVIYDQRRKILCGDNLKENIHEMLKRLIERSVSAYINLKLEQEYWDFKSLLTHCEEFFLIPGEISLEHFSTLNREEIVEVLTEKALLAYEKKENTLGEHNMRELEKVLMLRILDSKWMEHLDAMDMLRSGIGLRAYGQKDPLMEYKFEAYDMFQQMMENIQDDIVRYIFKLNIVKQAEDRLSTAHESRGDDETALTEKKKVQPIVKKNVVGRNEICPCGSGKKYKKCCGM